MTLNKLVKLTMLWTTWPWSSEVKQSLEQKKQSLTTAEAKIETLLE